MLKKMTKKERKAFKESYQNILDGETEKEMSSLEAAFEKKWAETGSDDIIDELSKIPNINPVDS